MAVQVGSSYDLQWLHDFAHHAGLDCNKSIFHGCATSSISQHLSSRSDCCDGIIHLVLPPASLLTGVYRSMGPAWLVHSIIDLFYCEVDGLSETVQRCLLLLGNGCAVDFDDCILHSYHL